jgi:transposase
VTALAFALTVGPVSRFRNSKKLVSYLGLNPSEESSGGRQRLGAISKQGNVMMRCLLVEAAQTALRFDPELRRDYLRLKFRRGVSGVAKVASHESWRCGCTGSCEKQPSQCRWLAMQGSPTCPMVDESPSCF